MIGKNNPLNIRYNPLNRWIGQTGHSRGFCDFSDFRYCIRVVAYLIMVSYRKKGVRTYAEIISRYAPTTENNTNIYINYVCSLLGVFPFDEPATIYDVAQLINYMSKFEGNSLVTFGYSVFDILHVINEFDLKFYEKD